MPTLTADGNTQTYRVKGPVRVWSDGTDGGGTLTWYTRDEGGTFVALVGGANTAAADQRFNFPEGAETILRGTLASSTTPTLKYGVEGNVEVIAG